MFWLLELWSVADSMPFINLVYSEDRDCRLLFRSCLIGIPLVSPSGWAHRFTWPISLNLLTRIYRISHLTWTICGQSLA